MTRFLFRHLKGRRLLVAVAIALTFVQVGTAIFAAFPLKFILDKIVHHRDPVVPIFGGLITSFDRYGSRNGLNDAEVHTQIGVILFSVAMLVVLEVVGAVVSYAQLLIATFVGQDIGAKLRRKIFAHLEHLTMGWHNQQRTGEIVQRITGNVTDVEKLVIDGLVDLLAGILTLIGVVVVMLLLNWQFTVLSMMVMPFLFVIVVVYTRWIKRASKRTARAAGQVSQVATEDFNAIAELKVFTLENWAAETFNGRVEEHRGSGTRAGRRQAEFDPMVQVLTVVSYVAILSAGCWIAAGHGHRFQALFLAIPTGTLTIGALTVFLAYSKQLYQPMRNLSKLMLLASNASSAVERIQEILDQPIEEQAPVGTYHGPTELAGDIVYRGVVFGYSEGRPVLHGIDLEIPVGKRIALVGLSGSGKTTLVRLLPRFYDPSEGSITIDGLDVRDYPLDVLRGNISLVLQDSVLFEGTIRDNIALGRSDATDEQVIDAAKQAHIYNTIIDLPDGFDAQVREQGKNFSSGQRQRLAIARAILRDAPILILDEPTANLDVEAEGEVMRAIERLTAGRTVIVISHRLSTLGHVDEIAVLEAGRIVERGTYEQLKSSGGAFAHLLAEQNRYAAEPISLGLANGKSPDGVGGTKDPAASTTAGDNVSKRKSRATTGEGTKRRSTSTQKEREPSSSPGAVADTASGNGVNRRPAGATKKKKEPSTPAGAVADTASGNGAKRRPVGAQKKEQESSSPPIDVAVIAPAPRSS